VSLGAVAIDVFMGVTLVALFLYVLYRIAVWAWKRARGAYVLGAALAPLGAAGNVSDPDFRLVHEAKQQKKREEDNPGDPPNDEQES
jgi:hypothetical protein